MREGHYELALFGRHGVIFTAVVKVENDYTWTTMVGDIDGVVGVTMKYIPPKDVLRSR